jgi:choline dehydrogenase
VNAADANGRWRIDLPGVGRNLQDRYEVTVIMMKVFSLLEGGTFRLPVAIPDRLERVAGRRNRLHTRNGSVRHPQTFSPDGETDLFMFGLPLPFRGYEIDY